jgi:DNA-binding HxlR family transcriptional regulator
MAARVRLPGHRFRSRCSIARTLELVGDKWTLLIVRDLLWHGKHTFQALQESDERIPTNILADRLRRLMAWGLVRREQYRDRPARFTYHLTEAAMSLEEVLYQIMRWGHGTLGGGMLERAKPENRRPDPD